MTGYLLDTSAISAYYFDQHPNHARCVAAINGLEANALRIVSVVTLAEIEFGIQLAEAENAVNLPEMRDRATKIRAHARLEISHHTSTCYAELKKCVAQRMLKNPRKRPRFLEDWVDKGSGKTLQLDENDLWICAQAKERDLTLVTTDKDFRAFEAADPDVRVLFVCE